MAEQMTTIQVTRQDAKKIKRLLPHLKSDAYRISELLKGYSMTGAGSIPAPADADKSVQPIPYIEVSPVGAGK